ncbi:MAG: beta strand repeat-containing protein [Bacilli bacterium]
MEKPLQMLLWGGFAVGVMTFGFFPAIWTVTQAGTARTVVGNAGLAQTLWGGQSGYQGPTVPSSLSASVQYPQATNVAIIPGALTPSITTLTWGASTWPPTLTIQGSGFGNPASTGETVTVADTTRGWTATGVVQSFTNTQIVLSSFTPTYGGGDPQNWADGLGSFVFAPGDALTVNVTNPETGQTGSFQAQTPTNMPLPTVMLSSPQVSVPYLALPSGAYNSSTGTVSYFPFYVFSRWPNGMNFSQAAQVSPWYPNQLWNTVSGTAPDGTQFVQASFTVTQAQSGTVSVPDATSNGWTDDFELIYVNGRPVAQSNSVGNFDPVPSSIPMFTSNSQQIPISLRAGTNTVTIEGMNTAGFGNLSPNPAGMDVKVADSGGQTLAWTGNASQWQSTGYVWGVGANWTEPSLQNTSVGEFVFSESQSSPVYASKENVITQGLAPGQTGTVTGTVSFNGTPLSGQAVNLSAQAGAFSGGSGTQATPSDYMVFTDSSGNFMVSYTAPQTAGTQTLSAMAGTVTATELAQVVGPPQITGVSWNTGTWPPQITVSGTNFGNSQGTVTIDDTKASTWSNNIAAGFWIAQTPIWKNGQLEVNQFQHYGEQGTLTIFRPGDPINIMLTNAQTGQSTTYTTTYPTNAPMPTVTMNAVATINTGQSTTITGQVTLNGVGLANQQVSLTASGGTLGASTVQTDASGNFSATYTAGNAGGTFSATALSDTGSASASVTINNPPQITGVSWNTGTWPPQLTITGTNLGASSGNVELLDQTQSAWWDNTGQTGPAMNPANTGADGMTANWSDTSIGLSGYGGYGQNVGWHDYLTPGDSLEVFVQTSSGQTTAYTTTYPSNAPMPSVQFSSMPGVEAGQTVTISGSVSFGGQGLANVPVTLSASAGNFPNGASVVTNGSGDFNISYTAPTSSGSVTFTATADSSQTTQSASVAPPNVTFNGMSAIQEGQSETVSGIVTTAGGAGLANVAVQFTTNGGSVSPTTVWTNGSGQWNATYTAPGSPNTYTVWASSGGSNAGSLVSVTSPMSITSVSVTQAIQAPPQFVINGTGFGSSTSGEYVQLYDTTRGWQGGTSGSAVILTVPTWNNNQIAISGMSNYGGGSGTWLFAPGDSVTANVTNPQTGQTASYSFTYPAWNQTLVNYAAGTGTQSTFAGSYGTSGIGGNTASGGSAGTDNGNPAYWFAQTRGIDVGQTVTAPLTIVVATGNSPSRGSGPAVAISTNGTTWTTIGFAPIPAIGTNYTYSFGTQTFRYVWVVSNSTVNAIDLFEIY